MNHRFRTAFWNGVVVTLGLASCAFGAERPSPEKLEFFEKHVRPVLVEHCYSCHSAESEQIKAGLRVDHRQGLLVGGDSGESLVPGDADASLLIEAIRYESYEMPPKGKLLDSEIRAMEKWVNEGAAWPDEKVAEENADENAFDLEKRKAEHWVWQPLSNPKPPVVADASWPSSDLDRFVLAKLEAEKLSPSAPTDKSSLIRRLYFDLIGLPPSIEQLDRHVADDGEGWVGRLTDELLESPHFGERWGRHWLDLVRYAESRGHEFDADAPDAFQYRDYVIRALNQDVPYDQLVREHIAGDLLSEPRLNPDKGFNESILGTGFWFLGEWVHSPVDTRKDESDRFDNMIDVMSKTFLGVTVSCARCHDHKFDAISTADYYSLSGFLQSSDFAQVRFESVEQNRRIATKLAELDASFLKRFSDLLRSKGTQRPAVTKRDLPHREGIVVDYASLAAEEFLQEGFIFGTGPVAAGTLRFDGSTKGRRLQIATSACASSDPFWDGIESITKSSDRSKLGKLPRSGRTLRTPTFDLKHGNVACFVEGPGHVVAVIDSHRLVSGPLHGNTIQAISGKQPWVKLNLERYVGGRVHLEFVPAKGAQMNVRLVTAGLDDRQLHDVKDALHAEQDSLTDFAALVDRWLYGESVHQDRIFADFESGTYDGWTVEGDAFGDRPHTLKTIAKYQGKINRVGKYFVNSHNNRGGAKGDQPTGSMTSQPFEIDFHSIEFLVGGGSYAGETCVQLLVDGKAVLSATGRNDNQMTLNKWDVGAFQGKSAQIRIVDRHQGGWGNIGVDHIVFRRVTRSTEANPDARSLLSEWAHERDELRKKIVLRSHLAMAMRDGTGEDGHILVRGNSSRPGKVVPRRFLTAVEGSDAMTIANGSGRLQLANSINDKLNPLSHRVIVNRVWHHLMGRGIVPTTDDFGVLGQRPTHPELLDHLARRFLAEGRSVKKLIRYIALSKTYQMSSGIDADAAERDPKNLLLHHRPLRRLEGEAIRDALLKISGRLDPKQYGLPVPVHLTSFMDGRGRPGKSGPLDGDGRRSIYLSVRRNFLPPFMLAFDTPVPFSSMGRRTSSNVPAQALILMNDPFVVEQAHLCAERVCEAYPQEERLEALYRTAFSRSPTDAEKRAADQFLSSAEAKQEAWKDLAHALVNAKEFIFIK